MKKIMNSIFVASVVAMPFLCAMCTNQKEAAAESAPGVEDFAINEVYKTASASYLCKGDTTYGDSVKVFTTASVSIQWPEKFGDNDIKALQDTLISRTFVEKKSTIDSCLVNFAAKPLGYGDAKLVKVDSVPMAEDVRILSQNITVKSIGFCERFVVFKVESDEYAGGAHPNYSAHFINYDFATGKVLDYADIFKPDSEESLKGVIMQSLCDKYYAADAKQMGERSGIFVDELKVSRDVYLLGDEVVFFYNPYEIAPWSVGSIEVHVPQYQIADYMTPEASALFK